MKSTLLSGLTRTLALLLGSIVFHSAPCTATENRGSEPPELVWKKTFSGSLNGTVGLDSEDFIYVNNGLRLRGLDTNGNSRWEGEAPTWEREWPISPVIVDGKFVVIPSSKGLLAYGLDGSKLWHLTDLDWREQLATPAAGFDGRVYFPVMRQNWNSILAAISAEGTIDWSHPLGNLDPRFAAPVVSPNGNIIVNNWYYRILDDQGFRVGEYGSVGWFTEGSPAIDQEGLIYGASWNKKLFCIDQRGREQWLRILDEPVVGGLSLDRARNLYFKDTAGHVFSYASNGTLRWRTDLNGATSPFDTEYSVPTLLQNGTLLIGSGATEGGLYCLDQATGAVIWIFRTQGRVVGSANVDSKDALVFGDDLGNLYKLAGTSGLAHSAWPKYHGDIANSGRPQLLLDVSANHGGIVIKEPESEVVQFRKVVSLTALANEGFQFEKWEGDLVSSQNPLTFYMTNSLELTAAFARLWQVDLTHSAGGVAVSEPAEGSLKEGTRVTVSALADDGYGFRGWEGYFTTNSNPLEFVLDTNVNLHAVFVPVVTITLHSSEGGKVSLLPSSPQYLLGDELVLVAEPEEGYRFGEWNGLPAGHPAQTRIVLTNDLEVSAEFRKLHTVFFGRSGEGSVEAVNGIYHDRGETITVRALPAEGWAFWRWEGAVQSTSNPLDLVVEGDMSLQAVFKRLFTVFLQDSTGGRIEVQPAQPAFIEGDIATIAAVPDKYHRFRCWTGSLTETNSSFTLVISTNLAIGAQFEPAYGLVLHPSKQDWSAGFRMIAEGEPGRKYRIEGSSAMQAWTPLVSFTNGLGAVEYLDRQAQGLNRRFYRVRPDE